MACRTAQRVGIAILAAQYRVDGIERESRSKLGYLIAASTEGCEGSKFAAVIIGKALEFT